MKELEILPKLKSLWNERASFSKIWKEVALKMCPSFLTGIQEKFSKMNNEQKGLCLRTSKCQLSLVSPTFWLMMYPGGITTQKRESKHSFIHLHKHFILAAPEAHRNPQARDKIRPTAVTIPNPSPIGHQGILHKHSKKKKKKIRSLKDLGYFLMENPS